MKNFPEFFFSRVFNPKFIFIFLRSSSKPIIINLNTDFCERVKAHFLINCINKSALIFRASNR